jgi:hypothetical protein
MEELQIEVEANGVFVARDVHLRSDPLLWNAASGRSRYPLHLITQRVMSCGGCGCWASHFCLGISCLGLHGLQNADEPSGSQRSATGNNGTANDPFRLPVLHLLPSIRVDSPGEAGLEHEDVNEKSTMTGRRNPPSCFPPSLLQDPGPSFVSFTNSESQISCANSSIDDHRKQGPSDTEISVAAYDLLSHPSDNIHSPQAPTKMSLKKKAIAIAKVALQVTAAGLKAAPIPNLDQIPNILLMLIETYKVSQLSGSLSQIVLNDPSKSLDYGWEQ